LRKLTSKVSGSETRNTTVTDAYDPIFFAMESDRDQPMAARKAAAKEACLSPEGSHTEGGE
jgi:hypothetical protein